VTFVVALLGGAFLLPASGVSWPLLIAIGAGYLLTAAAFSRWARNGAMESQRSESDALGLHQSANAAPSSSPQV
jgi:Na+-transporting NADH:ubiquinone oxidoreductase subunit NqrB